MNKKGVTLMEMMIVIIVMGIIATITTISITTIMQNQKEKVDQANAEFLGDVITMAHLDGNVIIQNGSLYNTLSERNFSGTGGWFYEDMDGYVTNRLVPQNPIAHNQYNENSGTYRFLFRVHGDEVDVYYYDESKVLIILHTFILESY